MLGRGFAQLVKRPDLRMVISAPCVWTWHGDGVVVQFQDYLLRHIDLAVGLFDQNLPTPRQQRKKFMARRLAHVSVTWF